MTSEEQLIECQVCGTEVYESELCEHAEHTYCPDCSKDANESEPRYDRNDLD